MYENRSNWAWSQVSFPQKHLLYTAPVKLPAIQASKGRILNTLLLNHSVFHIHFCLMRNRKNSWKYFHQWCLKPNLKITQELSINFVVAFTINDRSMQVEIFAVTCICRHWIINSQCLLCFVLLMQILLLYDVFQVSYCSVLICFDFNALQCYSQTSHKWPPKMQRVSGCLQDSNHRRSFTVHFTDFTMSSPDTIFLERMYYMQFSFYVNPCCL